MDCDSVFILTGGLSMDMVAGSMYLWNVIVKEIHRQQRAAAQKKISELLYTFILFSTLDAFL